MCGCFRVLKLGLNRGARIGQFQPRSRQELDHEGFPLLAYRELSFVLEVLEAIQVVKEEYAI